MDTLREHIGADAVNAALRRFLVKQTLRIIVPQEPSRAGVDRKLIERKRGDNVVDVETGG